MGADDDSNTIEEIEGISSYDAEREDGTVVLLEMHTYHMFDGVDGADSSDDNAVALPYVITIEQNSEKIVLLVKRHCLSKKKLESHRNSSPLK